MILGAQISSKQLRRLRENWEGEGVVEVRYEDLKRMLTDPPKPWVPTGKGHVLAWLALGAPGAGRRPRFGPLTPQELFEEIV